MDTSLLYLNIRFKYFPNLLTTVDVFNLRVEIDCSWDLMNFLRFKRNSVVF